jgi:hypothetical protein
VVAPPSKVQKGDYQFIRGSLDDLDHLPVLQNLGLNTSTPDSLAPAAEMVGMRKGDGRNAALFREVGRAAHQVDNMDELLSYARALNDQCAEPLGDMEVTKIVSSVWKMQTEGRNRFGQHGAWFPVAEISTWGADPDAFYLLAYLRAKNHPGATFMIANGLAETLGWSRKRLSAARCRLIELGYFRVVRYAAQHNPALYRLMLPSPIEHGEHKADAVLVGG